jgi:iron(III) transport system ATP-binding protein
MNQAARASVEFRSVVKQYGAVRAVNDISFTIEPGTLVTLLGPSGCGKTTTLRLIAGLEIATSGEILIGGKDVTLRSAADRDVSMVFQSYALFPHMTVFENVAYGPTVQRLPKDKTREMVHEKLALVGLSGLENRSPSELSGGQQQRVAVARALVMEPQVLLFDEPLSNLDAKLRRRVREEIRELQLKLNLTVAYVTHDQEEALAVSDRIIVMADGRIAQAGTPMELYEQPASRFVADFIGDANLVIADLIEERGERALVRLGALDLDLARRDARKGPVTLALRSESLSLRATRPDTPALLGRVTKTSYLGKHREYTVETSLGALFVIDRSDSRLLPPGREVWVTLAARGVVIVPV